MIRKTIQLETDLNIRVGHELVKELSAIGEPVAVTYKEHTVSGQELIDLVSLGAAKGSYLHISVEGEKAELALIAAEQILVDQARTGPTAQCFA